MAKFQKALKFFQGIGTVGSMNPQVVVSRHEKDMVEHPTETRQRFPNPLKIVADVASEDKSSILVLLRPQLSKPAHIRLAVDVYVRQRNYAHGLAISAT
jgi:hypothetical protein